jgi:uncharacterized protein YsxB (DUF464 family)
MIAVKIYKRNSKTVSVEAKGHSGYAKYGSDIVCGAVSAVVQTALLGLIEFSSGKVEYRKDEKSGYMYFTVPAPESEAEDIRQQAVLDAMKLGLSDIEKGYKAYVKTEVIPLCL